jgi:hypothetical protein
MRRYHPEPVREQNPCAQVGRHAQTGSGRQRRPPLGTVETRPTTGPPAAAQEGRIRPDGRPDRPQPWTARQRPAGQGEVSEGRGSQNKCRPRRANSTGSTGTAQTGQEVGPEQSRCRVTPDRAASQSKRRPHSVQEPITRPPNPVGASRRASTPGNRRPPAASECRSASSRGTSSAAAAGDDSAEAFSRPGMLSRETSARPRPAVTRSEATQDDARACPGAREGR